MVLSDSSAALYSEQAVTSSRDVGRSISAALRRVTSSRGLASNSIDILGVVDVAVKNASSDDDATNLDSLSGIAASRELITTCGDRLLDRRDAESDVADV